MNGLYPIYFRLMYFKFKPHFSSDFGFGKNCNFTCMNKLLVLFICCCTLTTSSVEHIDKGKPEYFANDKQLIVLFLVEVLGLFVLWTVVKCLLYQYLLSHGAWGVPWGVVSQGSEGLPLKESPRLRMDTLTYTSTLGNLYGPTPK